MPRPASREDVVAAVAALPRDRTTYVGIDGFGAAGKTSLAARLAERVAGVTVIHIDDFAAADIAEWDWPRLQRQVLDPLRAGHPGRYQRWDWDLDAGAEWHDVTPGGVLVIEGVSATRREVDVAWDLRIWVETPAPMRLRRALERDGAQRMELWRTNWIPAEQAWAAAQQPQFHVDLVLDGTG